MGFISADRINKATLLLTTPHSIKVVCTLAGAKSKAHVIVMSTMPAMLQKIETKGAQALAEALKINGTLINLYLQNNSIGDNGSLALSQALKTNSSLTTLDLWGNSIGDNGAQALAEALKRNSTLTTLYLQNNSIGDNGAQALCQGIQMNSSLTTLDLWCNRITDKGTMALFEVSHICRVGTQIRLKYASLDEF
ncbi:hypothetical protein BGZ94_003571 [Podila epigama]|nr:hypothetical protein BGZ94_003571 [Podila epigama]